jgi:hypothetical protein
MAVLNPDHIDQYRMIHQQGRYGITSVALRHVVQLCIVELSPRIVLDYGCGQSSLYRELASCRDLQVYRYDPAIPEISSLPVAKADLVINADVMEHIPEQDCSDVLGCLASISSNVYFNISTRLADQILPSGENAHCTVKSADWWSAKIGHHFEQSQIVYCLEDQCGIITWESIFPELYRVVWEQNTLKRKLARLQTPLHKRLFRSLRWSLRRIGLLRGR